MEKVFVCAGMGTAKNNNINEQARELGYLLAENNVEYVQGGTDKGLMGETLRAFITKSQNVSFVIPSAYYLYDAPNLIKLVGEDKFKVIKVDSEVERLKKIRECDRIIVLPGGTGTLEELLYCNETLRSKEHNSKVELVNIDGFFDGFLNQIHKNIEEGLSKPEAIKFNIVNNVSELDFNKNMEK